LLPNVAKSSYQVSITKKFEGYSHPDHESKLPRAQAVCTVVFSLFVADVKRYRLIAKEKEGEEGRPFPKPKGSSTLIT
jgi:hypothetical protein